ncbi:efflux transporter outer membrane subunit [Rhizobium sp. KVB221]|uniref:Efflux transporter outer membrane subunit n=1 Tax=Rhizobium setariae TaxID=2801340 RepID=A0A937CM26_9HYPH|nr:efflux transporter outer membrane subunit [Rhizobium setariae]MBL0373820.1 efflux transporter outer membrane subunit [Rhizobium setariae]
MRQKTLLAPTIALILSGCVVGPNYKPPIAELPAKYSEAKDKSAENVRLNPWWERFKDKRLNALVAEGMNENLSVLGSLERIVEAQANVVAAGAGALPQVNGSAGAIINGENSTNAKHTTNKTASAGLTASWLLDFFGQYKRSTEAANYSLDAAYDNVNVARLAYFSDLAVTYVDLRYYQESLALTRENLASRRVTLKLINDIKEAGSASRLDVVQAEGLVNQTLAEIPTLETGYHLAANHIATLLAVPAATMTASFARGSGQPMPRNATKTGIPADLIRNRPDIRQAERLLAASTASIGVAESQLYPSISLGGSIDGSRFSTRVGSGGLLSWSFGPTVVVPIFNGGALKAEVDIANSVARQQYIAWKQVVLNAIEEVEDAQIALHRDYQTVYALRRLVVSYEEALSLARESYKGGTATVLDILDAERNVANGRLTLATSIRNLARDYIALNVAIGGGSDIGSPIKTQ